MDPSRTWRPAIPKGEEPKAPSHLSRKGVGRRLVGAGVGIGSGLHFWIAMGLLAVTAKHRRSPISHTWLKAWV